MTRSATKRPPPHDWARALEQTLRAPAGAAGEPEASLRLEKQHRDQDWLAPMTLEKPTAMVSSSAANTESWTAS